MPDDLSPILAWPALEGAVAELPPFPCERAVWGKAHGAGSDFRWLAVSPAFPTRRPGVEREIALGSEDAPERATLWRTVGETHYAVSCYPSRAIDAAGRTGFLEKQVLAWSRPPGLPAALGALALLPRAATYGDEVWWDERGDVRWAEADWSLPIAAPAVSPSLGALVQAVERGIAALAAAVPEEALAELYAGLLAGGRALRLPGLGQPLPPESLAALLLPLPRVRADALSVLGWLPSRRVDADDLARWDLVLGGAAAPASTLVPPSEAQRREGRALARALLARDPGRRAGAPRPRTAGSGAAGPEAIPLSMWGPSAAGKTVLLAQLYLQLYRHEESDWKIYPTRDALAFIDQMRDQIPKANLFPAVTPVGHTEQIEYEFCHRRSGARAILELQDRAGRDFEDLTEDARERLLAARGLVLLFDPVRRRDQLEREVSRTLEQVYVASGREAQRDGRPIAVCISKADLLIDSPADLERARAFPHDFVRERVDPVLVRLLDYFCADYQLFPVSAAGLRLRYGALEPVVFYDESLGPRLGPHGEPFNLMAPFAWLLDRVTAERP